MHNMRHDSHINIYGRIGNTFHKLSATTRITIRQTFFRMCALWQKKNSRNARNSAIIIRHWSSYRSSYTSYM